MADHHMMVKGTGPMALSAFMKDRFPDRFNDWLNTMPQSSRDIHAKPILAFENYTVYDSLVIPIQTLCDLCFGGDEAGAWETGRHSAGYALKGFYKIFFRFSSPQFIIDRASRVFSNYYPEGALYVADSSQNRCVLQITKFPEPYRLIEVNIAGWVDGVLELLDKKERNVETIKRMSDGDPVTEYVITWG
ncbi:hypothetical protein JW948_10220 [bacterium]|nr:hypothetical protein [bacterium]